MYRRLGRSENISNLKKLIFLTYHLTHSDINFFIYQVRYLITWHNRTKCLSVLCLFCSCLSYLLEKFMDFRLKLFILHMWVGSTHGPINCNDAKTKCRHLKELTCKGTLGEVFIRVYRWRNSQSCWSFRPSFVSYCPSNLLSAPSPPRVKVYRNY
jgi:hypothetical protein